MVNPKRINTLQLKRRGGGAGEFEMSFTAICIKAVATCTQVPWVRSLMAAHAEWRYGCPRGSRPTLAVSRLVSSPALLHRVISVNFERMNSYMRQLILCFFFFIQGMDEFLKMHYRQILALTMSFPRFWAFQARERSKDELPPDEPIYLMNELH